MFSRWMGGVVRDQMQIILIELDGLWRWWWSLELWARPGGFCSLLRDGEWNARTTVKDLKTGSSPRRKDWRVSSEGLETTVFAQSKQQKSEGRQTKQDRLERVGYGGGCSGDG
jgi:hypothetical protein